MLNAVSEWPPVLQHREWVPADGDSLCQRCGGFNPVWWVEHAVWNKVVGHEGGILCPPCFIQLAVELGLYRTGAWQLYPPGELG